VCVYVCMYVYYTATHTHAAEMTSSPCTLRAERDATTTRRNRVRERDRISLAHFQGLFYMHARTHTRTHAHTHTHTHNHTHIHTYHPRARSSSGTSLGDGGLPAPGDAHLKCQRPSAFTYKRYSRMTFENHIYACMAASISGRNAQMSVPYHTYTTRQIYADISEFAPAIVLDN